MFGTKKTKLITRNKQCQGPQNYVLDPRFHSISRKSSKNQMNTQRARKIKKVQAKKFVKSNKSNKKFFFREIAFLAVLKL